MFGLDTGKLAPWSRRRALAAFISALAAMALATAVAGRGCEMDDSSPEGIVQDFLAAAEAGDIASLYEYFGPATRAGLKAEAKRASDLAGGAHRFRPQDMLGIRTGEFGGVRDVRLLEQSFETLASTSLAADQPAASDSHRVRARAVVEVERANGQRGRFVVVLIDEVWKLELPAFVPAAQ